MKAICISDGDSAAELVLFLPFFGRPAVDPPLDLVELFGFLIGHNCLKPPSHILNSSRVWRANRLSKAGTFLINPCSWAYRTRVSRTLRFGSKP